MNRRNFFKVVTGFVAGIFAGSVKSKEDFPIPADPLKDKFVLNHMQRLRIEAAEKAANPPYVLFDDSKTIQEAIDLAAKDGGGIVYFPKGTYNLKYGIIV